MCEVLLLTMLNLAWQARFMIIHHQAGYLDVLLPDDGSQRHSIPTWNFSPTPEEHSHCPIAIHCPRNKWLISCKELLPKISTCFIHAVLLPPKLPTVETQKKQATRTEISMIHKQASRRCVCMTWALLPSWNLANCVQDFQVCLWRRLRDVPPVEWISGTKSDGQNIFQNMRWYHVSAV